MVRRRRKGRKNKEGKREAKCSAMVQGFLFREWRNVGRMFDDLVIDNVDDGHKFGRKVLRKLRNANDKRHRSVQIGHKRQGENGNERTLQTIRAKKRNH
jgi:hypothetical protein